MRGVFVSLVFTILAVTELHGAVSSSPRPQPSPGSPDAAAVVTATTAAPPKIVGLSVSALASRRPVFFPRRNLLKNGTTIKAPVVKRQTSPSDDDVQVTLDESVPVRTDDVAIDPVSEDTADPAESGSWSETKADTAEEDSTSGEDNKDEGETRKSESDSSENSSSSEAESDNTEEKDEHSVAKRSFDSPVVLLFKDVIHRLLRFAQWILDLVGLARWVQFFMDKFNAVDSVVPLRKPAAELFSRSVSPEWRALADLAYDTYYNYDL